MNRWTIRELFARYRLEPALRDIFVEGKTDRSVYRWFLSRSGSDAKVLTIDSVDIPTTLLADRMLSDGNKQRVVTLAFELNTLFGNEAPQFTCIVDTDEDRLLRRMIELPQLLWTDYASLEAYLFDETHVGKFVHVVLGCDDVNVTDMLAEYGKVLRELFLIRAAVRECNLAVRWLSFTDCCTRVGTEIRLDRNEFFQRLLNASSLRQSEEQLLAATGVLRTRLEADARHGMNGSDFVALLHWERRAQSQQRGLRNEDAVRAALVACFEYGMLCEWPLFKSIKNRVSS